MSLVETFFERDLSEAEAEQLEALLAASPEAAAQMAALAERDYRASGLPDPVAPPPRRRRLWLWLLPLAALGGGAWWLARDQAPAVQMVLEQADSFEESNLEPVAPPPRAPSAPARPKPDLEPRLSQPVRPGGPRLGLKVDGAEAGLVKVRVFDASGAVVRHLHHGPMSEGSHKLSWDGRTDTGQQAPPGRYLLEVQSAAGVSRQQIKL